uniref:Uncharacterized protein n=1 Tax=Ditylenchus dipsaci TaxID=166011 RepID=A0A915CQI7_9BILA
ANNVSAAYNQMVQQAKNTKKAVSQERTGDSRGVRAAPSSSIQEDSSSEKSSDSSSISEEASSGGQCQCKCGGCPCYSGGRSRGNSTHSSEKFASLCLTIETLGNNASVDRDSSDSDAARQTRSMMNLRHLQIDRSNDADHQNKEKKFTAWLSPTESKSNRVSKHWLTWCNTTMRSWMPRIRASTEEAAVECPVSPTLELVEVTNIPPKSPSLLPEVPPVSPNAWISPSRGDFIPSSMEDVDSDCILLPSLEVVG